jgi:hypothetical protein
MKAKSALILTLSWTLHLVLLVTEHSPLFQGCDGSPDEKEQKEAHSLSLFCFLERMETLLSGLVKASYNAILYSALPHFGTSVK